MNTESVRVSRLSAAGPSVSVPPVSEPLPILVADDDEMVRQSLHLLLSTAGFSVTEATDALDALSRMEERRPSLVISDINMPGNDHLEFVKAVAERYPGLPVILLTAFPSVETAIESVNLAVVAYLVKPPRAEQLLAAVSSAIGHFEARAAIERGLSRLESWRDDLEKLERLTLNARAATTANSSAAYLEITLRHLMESLLDVREVVSVLASAPAGAQSVRSLELARALEETVGVLEKTKRLFKSKDLGELRQKLETILAAVRG